MHQLFVITQMSNIPALKLTKCQIQKLWNHPNGKSRLSAIIQVLSPKALYNLLWVFGLSPRLSVILPCFTPVKIRRGIRKTIPRIRKTVIIWTLFKSEVRWGEVTSSWFYTKDKASSKLSEGGWSLEFAMVCLSILSNQQQHILVPN